MDNAEAIGILRGTTSPASVLHPQIAADMGADALELLQWQAETQAHVTHQSGRWRCSVGWFTSVDGASPTEVLLKARSEWEKEKKR